ncbi:MAG: EI24 domain-containing protein [Pseudomonadota bacterium]
MIFTDFFKACAQMGDPRFLKVMLKGIGITLLLLIGFYALTLWAVSHIGIIAWLAERVGLSTALVGGVLGVGSVILMIGLSAFLMVPVASAITSLFLEDVATAVEDTHYPGTIKFTQSMGEAILETLQFLGIVLVANIGAFVVFLILPILGPLPFWATNGYLLGREYFTMVARRHLGPDGAKHMFRTHQGTVWFAGFLMAIPLTVPILNLIIPTLGVATFTHVYHRLTPSG